MIKLDGLDEAIIGQANVWLEDSRYDRLVYDAFKIINILMNRDGASYEDAIDYIDINIEGAYVGPHTPIVVWNYDE